MLLHVPDDTLVHSFFFFVVDVSGVSEMPLSVLLIKYKPQIRRIVGRRMDPLTGKIYHVEFNPAPTFQIMERLVLRSDDTEGESLCHACIVSLSSSLS